MKAAVKQAKQSTLDNLSFQFNTNRSKEATTPTKTIVINSIADTTKENELALTVEFSSVAFKGVIFKNKL